MTYFDGLIQSLSIANCFIVATLPAFSMLVLWALALLAGAVLGLGCHEDVLSIAVKALRNNDRGNVSAPGSQDKENAANSATVGVETSASVGVVAVAVRNPLPAAAGSFIPVAHDGE